MIFWDIFVIAVPFIGAASFWIYYAVSGRKKPPRKEDIPAENVAEETNNPQNTEEGEMKDPPCEAG